jgi:deoxyribonuclease-4
MTKILTIKWDIGSHTCFSGKIYDTVNESIKKGMTATQFFMGNPKSYNRTKIDKEDIDKTKKLCERYPMNIFSHFPYIANLSGSKAQLAWEDNKEQDEKTMKVITELEYELNILSNFNKGKNGVVIHPGNYTDRKIGIKTIAKSINKIKFKKDAKLLLENSAGQGTSLATTFEEIKEIYDQVDKDKQKNIGVCIDTAHIYGYGLYDLSKIEEIERLFDDFDRIIGLDKFTLLHLNDSEVPLGSKKDRHACIGTGYIWKENKESLIVLLNKCKKYKIPAILETNCSDMFVMGMLSECNK